MCLCRAWGYDDDGRWLAGCVTRPHNRQPATRWANLSRRTPSNTHCWFDHKVSSVEPERPVRETSIEQVIKDTWFMSLLSFCGVILPLYKLLLWIARGATSCWHADIKYPGRPSVRAYRLGQRRSTAGIKDALPKVNRRGQLLYHWDQRTDIHRPGEREKGGVCAWVQRGRDRWVWEDEMEEGIAIYMWLVRFIRHESPDQKNSNWLRWSKIYI